MSAQRSIAFVPLAPGTVIATVRCKTPSSAVLSPGLFECRYNEEWHTVSELIDAGVLVQTCPLHYEEAPAPNYFSQGQLATMDSTRKYRGAVIRSLRHRLTLQGADVTLSTLHVPDARAWECFHEGRWQPVADLVTAGVLRQRGATLYDEAIAGEAPQHRSDTGP